MKIAFRISGTASVTPEEARQIRAVKDKATLLRQWGYRFESWAGDTPFIENREREIGASVTIIDEDNESFVE